MSSVEKKNAERRAQNEERRKLRSASPVLSSAFCVLRSAFCVLVLSACATTRPAVAPPPPPSYESAIAQQLSRPALHGAIWGILVEDEAGHVLYARNEHTLFMPASNRKLFAAATIVNCLGLGARIPTELWLDGEDVVLKGYGDPSLGSWRYGREDDLTELADLLLGRGVTRVRDVVADVSAYDRVTIPGSWKYGNLGYDYAAPVDALAWGENEIPTDRAVADPALHAANALRGALVSRGIDVGSVRVQSEPRTYTTRLATIDSPFVSHLLTTVLKNSHNLYTEMLFKRTGNGTYGEAFAGEQSMLLQEAGIARGEARFADGSGLSPDDLVTPAAIIRILRWMNDPARRGTWWTLLAQPNNEGTLRRRLVPLEHRLRAKTGTINGVNALSGIIRMPDGSHRYFSVIVNHHLDDGDIAVEAIDAIVSELAR
jgi:D-alanyl-D-alanine carboxypeptidase/D-alanyl-D-alanine-endopeptidase (penicillin-binding protein 4)